MLPLYLLTNSKGQKISVELKSHEKIEGVLDKVDSWMNLTLKKVKLQEFGEWHEIPEIYIKGRFIKSMTLQHDIIEVVKAATNNKNSNSGNSRDNNYNNNGRRSQYNNNNNNNYNNNNYNNNNNNNNNRRRNYNSGGGNNYLNNNNGRQSRNYHNQNNNNNNNNNNNKQPVGGYAEFHQPISQIEQSTHLKL